MIKSTTTPRTTCIGKLDQMNRHGRNRSIEADFEIQVFLPKNFKFKIRDDGLRYSTSRSRPQWSWKFRLKEKASMVSDISSQGIRLRKANPLPKNIKFP
jgi:hypothetical protein